MAYILLPTGVTLPYAGAAAPAGWALCNGAAMSRTAFAALFAVIGTTFGAGDGSTTFNLPDLRGRSPIGAGTGTGLTNRALGATVGEEAHLLATAEIPAHNHPITDPGHTHTKSTAATAQGQSGSGFFVTDPGAAGSGSYTTGSGTTGITVGNTGSGGSHNNMQPSLALNYIIKT